MLIYNPISFHGILGAAPSEPQKNLLIRDFIVLITRLILSGLGLFTGGGSDEKSSGQDAICLRADLV
jgi:hypothetical protein